jgi:hypothetical protein
MLSRFSLTSVTHHHVINYVNFNSDRPSSEQNQVPLENLDSQQEKQISKIKKLQDIGLTEDEIGELLEIPLELVKSANFESN